MSTPYSCTGAQHPRPPYQAPEAHGCASVKGGYRTARQGAGRRSDGSPHSLFMGQPRAQTQTQAQADSHSRSP